VNIEAISRRRWIVFSVAALIAALAIFVGSVILIHNSKVSAVRPGVSQITARIVSEMNYSDLAKVSANQFSKHYSIPDGVISDSSLYMSKSSDSASELACFILTDTSKFPQLQTAVTSHINAKASGFKSLNPAQYNALKSASVTQNGKYVLVSVGSNPAADAKLFNEILK
jgi:hypothetical protein